MKANPRWVRFSLAAFAVMAAAVPGFAILDIYNFDWYYFGGTGGESFAGNFTAYHIWYAQLSSFLFRPSYVRTWDSRGISDCSWSYGSLQES